MKVNTVKFAALATAAALGFGLSGGAMAATANGSIAVSASVSASCSLTVPTLAFGTYDPVVANASSPLTATANITVKCSSGFTPTITLNDGANASGTTKRMLNGAANYLTYNIFQPTDLTGAGAAGCTATEWGSVAGAVAITGTWDAATSNNYRLCGNVPAGQTPPAGAYADTVTATLTF